jgi:flagellar biosynthetic protein FliR
MIVAPALPPPAIGEGLAAFGSMLVAETTAGLLIGFSLRVAVFILQIFGAVAAQSLSMTQLFGPGLGHDQESPLATIFIAAGLALACAAGLHIKVAVAAAETYDVIPFGAVANAGAAATHVVNEASAAFSIAFGLSAPFVLLGMAYAAALAAANRAMPQMAAVFVGAPAITLAGLTLVAGASWAVLSRWSEVSAGLFVSPLEGLP